MKAKDLKKVSEKIENIYKRISDANECGDYKIVIPHFRHVDERVKIQLIDDGFKVYKGDWDGVLTGALIIEW